VSYDKIPLRSLLWTLEGNPEIRVRDYASRDDAIQNRFPVRTWRGNASDTVSPFGGLGYEAEHAAVISMTIDKYSGAFVFKISTKGA
jgi:hypothetical protein